MSAMWARVIFCELPCRPPPSMPTPRRRRNPIKPDRMRALVLLDGCGAEGCTEALLHAHGFATADIVELVRGGLASATAERAVAGSRIRWRLPRCGSPIRGGACWRR